MPIRLTVLLLLGVGLTLALTNAAGPGAQLLNAFASVVLTGLPAAYGWFVGRWRALVAAVPVAAVGALATTLACCRGGQGNYIFDHVYEPGVAHWLLLTVFYVIPFILLIAVGVGAKRIAVRIRGDAAEHRAGR